MAKGYDVDMLKDFFEQLKCALQVDHFELTAGPDAFNPELAEQTKRTARKRGILRLLSEFYLKKDKPELTDQEMQEAMRRFGAGMAQKRDAELRHLEALEDVLQEARAHAAGRGVKISIPASKVLDGSWFAGHGG